MIAHPPLARLLPRSTAQRARVTAHAIVDWCQVAVSVIAHGVALVVPVVILAGVAFAMAIAVTGTSARRRAPILVAPPPPPPVELCGPRTSPLETRFDCVRRPHAQRPVVTPAR